MPWLLGNIKLILAIAAAGGLFIGGWVTHGWYYGSQQTNQAVIAANKAEDGQSKIIQYEQKAKVLYATSKDACLTTAMPDGIRGLLTKPAKLP